MDGHPLVSVGVPVYNDGPTVLASLNALRAQTYQNIEIIIGDNASTDETEDVCRQFLFEESRCKYYRLDSNYGAPSNFNFVFRQSTGSLFLWAAADDVLDLQFIEQGVRFLSANPDVILSAPLTRVWLPSLSVPFYSSVVDGLGRDTRGFRRIVNSYTRMPMHAIYGVFRSNVIENTCMLNSVLGSDVAFMQEVSLRGAIETNRLQILDYRARERWNSSAEDLRVFSGDPVRESSGAGVITSPALLLLWDRMSRIRRIDESRLYRSASIFIVAILEIRRVLFMLLNRVLLAVLGKRLHRLWIQWTYWRILHSEDILVQEREAYTERVIMARFARRESR